MLCIDHIRLRQVDTICLNRGRAGCILKGPVQCCDGGVAFCHVDCRLPRSGRDREICECCTLSRRKTDPGSQRCHRIESPASRTGHIRICSGKIRSVTTDQRPLVRFDARGDDGPILT